jgi:hypothetical protein
MDMKSLKALFVAAGLVAVTVTAVPNAQAAVLTVNTISAEWTNPVGGTNIVNNGVQSNPTAAEIRWGVTNGSQPQSGFDFLTAAPPSFDVTTDEAFSLGTFTHHNNTIESGPITSVDLALNLDIGGTGVGPFLTVFDFVETNNGCSPQPDCANDPSTLSGLDTKTIFSVGDQAYALTILGFSFDDGETFFDFLSTPEGQQGVGQLYAKVSAVPLPAAVWLFLSALSALGVSAWRRRTVSDAA